jgi:hypothetical protein
LAYFKDIPLCLPNPSRFEHKPELLAIVLVYLGIYQSSAIRWQTHGCLALIGVSGEGLYISGSILPI